jgi:hypothetical protein
MAISGEKIRLFARGLCPKDADAQAGRHGIKSTTNEA